MSQIMLLRHNISHNLITCCLSYRSPSTQTPVSGTAALSVLPSCQPARRERKSWSCWGKPSTGDSSSPSDNRPPQDAQMSSPGTTFTTKPTFEVVHSGMHDTASLLLWSEHFHVSFSQHTTWFQTSQISDSYFFPSPFQFRISRSRILVQGSRGASSERSDRRLMGAGHSSGVMLFIEMYSNLLLFCSPEWRIIITDTWRYFYKTDAWNYTTDMNLAAFPKDFSTDNAKNVSSLYERITVLPVP